MPKSGAGAKYLGRMVEGQPVDFLSGIPARDLTAEEWNGLSKDLKAAALATGLYEVGAAAKEGDA